MKIAEGLFFVILVGIAVLGVRAFKGNHKTTNRHPGEVIVLCDLSLSLKPGEIDAEAAIAFRFIRSDQLAPGGRFRVYIADRDPQRNLTLDGTKGTPYYEDEKEREASRLSKLEEDLRTKITSYTRTNPRVDTTCLFKALRIAPQLFVEQQEDEPRKILVISDMVEDCSNNGDPRNREELQRRMRAAGEQYPLSDMTGIDVFAAVPQGIGKVEIDWLRPEWTSTLHTAHAKSFKIGLIDDLLPTTNQE
ncbi:MAG TPA: hypothetical protein VEU96_11470 [Bryobacteraceae bacterium]|nr:hypothetical protein [Bryobacteraceae bacterium]